MTTADARVAPVGTRKRRSGSLSSAVGPGMLPIGFAQIAAWEAAAVAIPLSFHSVSPPARIAIATLAALVIATTSVRFAGRHLVGWTLTWIYYRLRQHDDRRLATDPLRVLAHDFRLRQHVDRAGNRFGIAGVGDGWTAVIRVAGEPDISSLLTVLREACENTDIPLAGAQLTIRTDAGKRVYLLAVRYRPAEAPLAARARGGGELGELRATARAALGVMGALANAGYGSMLLEAGELATELRATLGAQGAMVLDGWRSWSAGGTTQACFAPLTRTDLPGVLGAHARAAAFTVTSYTLRRTTFGRLRDDVTIRVARYQGTRKPPRARDLDVPVAPLYGRHAAAVRQTLPLALPR